MAVTQAQIDAFKTHCVKKPNHILNTDELQKQWTPGFFEHTVKENENLQSIAKYYLNDQKAPYGFDWKWLCRFNFGVDYPPYVNYMLIDKFGIDVSSEAEMNKNRTKDHKNYSFKGNGNEKLKIPFLAGASKPGSISPNRQNVIQRRAIKITSANGPTFMTADIASNFSVTGYSVDKREVTQQKMNSVRWWITNITKKDIGETDDRGSIHELSKLKGEDSGKTGEKVKLTIIQADVTSGKYRIGDWIRMYPYFDDKANIDLLVYVQFRLIAVEFKHDIPRTEIDGGSIAANDPINKIHNPTVVLIDAKTEQTCAKFRLTKVTSDVKKDDAGHDVIVDGKQVMIPAISVNDEGFIWKIKSIPGKATFVKIKFKPENTGSDCLVYGTEPGYIRLEGWCLEAEKYCVSKIVKVVHEREIPYRVNLLTGKNNALHTDETVANLQEIFKVQNIYLRPVGVALVPDSDVSDGKKMNASVPPDEVITQAQIDVDGTPTNVPGYFNITNVDNGYVDIVPLAVPAQQDAYEAATTRALASLATLNARKADYDVAVVAGVVGDINTARIARDAAQTTFNADLATYNAAKALAEANTAPNRAAKASASVATAGVYLINARPNVVNFALIKRLNSSSTLGMGPTAMRNLLTQPTECRGVATTGMLLTFTGPDEETIWQDAPKKFKDTDIDDVAVTDSLKKMKMFSTPDTNPGHENYGGVILPNSSSLQNTMTGQGGNRAKALTLVGATYAHEIGHVVGIRHRGGDPTGEGISPDLLPSSVTNIMYWTEDAGNNPADWDLIQAEVFRGCVLCFDDDNSNKGNLEIKAFTPRPNALSGAKNTDKTFNLEVRRKGNEIAGAFLNFWIEGTRTAIKIKQVDNWTKTSRKMTTGLAKITIEFTGNTGNVAKLVIMAGDNDDLVTLEITCTVT
jgi:hypothetical protein